MNLRIPGCHGSYTVVGDGTIALNWFCRDRPGWARMLGLVKSIPRRVFDSTDKRWYIPATEENIEMLQQSGWKAVGQKAAGPVAMVGKVPVPKKYAEYALAPEQVPATDPAAE